MAVATALRQAVTLRSVLREQDLSAAQTKGVYRVILLREGPGNPRDKHYYTAAAIQQGVDIFNNLPCYADHPDSVEEEARPERSVRDMVGWFENVTTEQDEVRDNLMMVGDLVTIPGKATDWVRSLLDGALLKKERNPQGPDLVGLSINATGVTTPMEVGDEDWNAVTEFVEAKSCDLVTQAGAGGKIVALKEALRRALEGTMSAIQVQKVAQQLRDLRDPNMTPMIDALDKIHADLTHEKRPDGMEEDPTVTEAEKKAAEAKAAEKKAAEDEVDVKSFAKQAERLRSRREKLAAEMEEIDTALGMKAEEKPEEEAEAITAAEPEGEEEAKAAEAEDDKKDGATADDSKDGDAKDDDAKDGGDDDAPSFEEWSKQGEGEEETYMAEDGDEPGDADVQSAMTALQGLDNLPDDVQAKVDDLLQALANMQQGEADAEARAAEPEEETEGNIDLKTDAEPEDEEESERAAEGEKMAEEMPGLPKAKIAKAGESDKKAGRKIALALPAELKAAVARQMFEATRRAAKSNGKTVTAREKALMIENAKLRAAAAILKESARIQKLLEKHGVPREAWEYWTHILPGIDEARVERMIEGFKRAVAQSAGLDVAQAPRGTTVVAADDDMTDDLKDQGVPVKESER